MSPVAHRLCWIEESGDQVLIWRYDSFIEQGFTAEAAEVLAVQEVSPSDTRRLIEAGCPPALALRIVL